jgi:hypothetical protein
MITTSVKFASKQLNLRLTTRTIRKVLSEDKINPINLLLNAVDTNNLEDLLKIIKLASVEEISLDELSDLYDEWIDEGYGLKELTALTFEVFRLAGLAFLKHEKRTAETLASIGITVPESKIETDEETENRIKRAMESEKNA